MKIAKRITILLFVCAVIVWGIGKARYINKDTTPPVIQAQTDELHVSAESGEEQLKTGLTATDDVDGDLTSEIIVGTIHPFTEKGVSKVEYIVFDSNNNVGRYERTVCFEDYESPKLHLSQPLAYEQDGQIDISDRLTATDMLEGDISNKVRYSSLNLKTDEEGTYMLRVEVKNSYGDKVLHELPMNIIPYNYDSEAIELKEYLVYVKAGESLSARDYIKDVDGGSKDDVKISYEVNLKKPGEGQICYTLKNEGKESYVTYLTVIVTE